MSIGTCQESSPEQCWSIHLQLGWAGLFTLRLASLTLAGALLNGALGLRAQAQAADEYQVKAAFLYYFAKFVEWSPEVFSNDRAVFVVGVLGDDPFGSALEQGLNGKSINGRQLTIKRLKWGQNLRDCQLLFICASEKKRLAQILDSLKGVGVVTISDLNNFCQQGGLIGFILEDNKVRFVINTDVAEQARLRISSKLLSLAKAVLGERHAGRN
jgi:hypothetical protein